MVKRSNDTQLTKDSAYLDDDRDNRDEPLEFAKKAAPDVLARRKIAVPKSRLGTQGAGSTNGTSSLFSKPSAPSPSKSRELLWRSLNEAFADKISQYTADKTGGLLNQSWVPIVQKYLDQADRISTGALDVPIPKPAPLQQTQQQTQPLFGQPKPIQPAPVSSTTAPAPAPASASSNPFAFLKNTPQQEEQQSQPVSRPLFSTGSSAPSSFGAGSSSGSTPISINFSAPTSSFKFQGTSGAVSSNKPAAAGTSATAPISLTDDSDESSDDEVKIQGPSFTVTRLPQAANSAFSFGQSDKQSSSQSLGPVGSGFVFNQKTSSASSPFKFDQKSLPTSAAATNAPTAPAAADAKFPFAAPPATSKPFSSNASDHTWTPDKAIKLSSSSAPFAAAKEGGEKDSKPSTAPSPFKFPSATAPAFGSSASGFKAPPPSASSPFQFFASKPMSTTPVASQPTLSFGGLSNNSSSSLVSGSALPLSSTTNQPTTNNEENEADDQEETKEASPSADLTEKGPGEENEDTVYEKKAKLFQWAENTYKVQGLGLLRVLVHKETKKARMLLRAEGSGRVVLNTLLRSSTKYSREGKNNVKFMDVKNGQPVTYLLRVKTEDDSAELAQILEQNKS